MNKISGIIPANARVTTVDLRNSGTARPGTPAFGREVGTTAIAERRTKQAAVEKAMYEQKNLMNLREPSKDPHVEIVSKMADNFFMKNATASNEGEELEYLDSTNDMEIENSPIKLENPNDVESELDIDSSEIGNSPVTAKSKNANPSKVVVTINRAEPDEDEGEDGLIQGRYLDVQA